jgi:excisionase family DNA binding protein
MIIPSIGVAGCFMLKRKDVLTTGQVAQICNVAPRTVTKWFDSGQLRGYRIPGSRDRRIPFNELVRFMKSHSIPTENIEKGHIRILIIDSSEDACRVLTETLSAKGSFDIQSAHNSFDAGLMAQKFLPNLVLINLMASNINALELCSHIRINADMKESKIAAIAAGLGANETSALVSRGFDSVITDLHNLDQILHIIQQTCSIF